MNRWIFPRDFLSVFDLDKCCCDRFELFSFCKSNVWGFLGFLKTWTGTGYLLELWFSGLYKVLCENILFPVTEE
ncbi:unnamed protein product [Blepharisma stoltei]|uniref:Uncharacterized protein n=1 Tax=Blepharisma stoltei TaxID=1481888 RepID=A0AAU9J1A5_9CILI|nr:unnamed protein product [Blepharisma stoltei]